MWLFGLVAALVVSLILLRLSLLVVVVHGYSMLPTIRPGDRVLVFRYWPRRGLRTGQVVLLRPTAVYLHQYAVKRITALPGQHVEPTAAGDRHRAWTGRIPPGTVFVEGDAEDSIDSSHVGPLPADRVAGIVFARLSRSRRQPGRRQA